MINIFHFVNKKRKTLDAIDRSLIVGLITVGLNGEVFGLHYLATFVRSDLVASTFSTPSGYQ
jgi:hypothetical protein